MKLRALVLVTLPFALLDSTTNAQGTVQLYFDNDCTRPNGASISLIPYGCLPTLKAVAIAALSLPFCATGQPMLFISDVLQCKQPSLGPIVNSGNVGDCLYLPSGSGIASAAFMCVGDSINTPIIPPATSKTAPSSLSVISPILSTPTRIITASTGSVPSQPSLPSSSSETTAPSTGMSLSDRIALGCGLGIGLPSLLVAILTWYYKHQDRRRQRVMPRLRLVPHDGPPPPYELHVRY
jgi:hypothetical protein